MNTYNVLYERNDDNKTRLGLITVRAENETDALKEAAAVLANFDRSRYTTGAIRRPIGILNAAYTANSNPQIFVKAEPPSTPTWIAKGDLER